MSTATQSHAKVGSHKRTMYLIAALLLSLGAMVSVFWYVGIQSNYDKVLGELQAVHEPPACEISQCRGHFGLFG